MYDSSGSSSPNSQPPAFNLPGVILLLIVLMLAIHAIRDFTPLLDAQSVFLNLIFIPARYGDLSHLFQSELIPITYFTSMVSYAFIHADWTHVIFNILWMTVFGTIVARRFGPDRFLLLSACGAVGGALLHLAFHWNDFVPMVGASAAVSAQMGAAMRFMFSVPNMPFVSSSASDPRLVAPAPTLPQILRDRRVMTFIGVWVLISLVFAFAGEIVIGGGGDIAWQAHFGGFIVGFLGFPIFDRKYFGPRLVK